jgi:hypothetical protein
MAVPGDDRTHDIEGQLDEREASEPRLVLATVGFVLAGVMSFAIFLCLAAEAVALSFASLQLFGDGAAEGCEREQAQTNLGLAGMTFIFGAARCFHMADEEMRRLGRA